MRITRKTFNKKNIKNFILISAGSIFVALSINLFLLSQKISPGGVSGIATVIHYTLGLPVGIVVLAINIPLFITGVLTLGKGFGVGSIYSTLLLSYTIDLTAGLQPLTKDILLSSIFGGVLMGLGLALVFKAGATTGGTDIPAKILNRYAPHMAISKFLLFIDGAVILSAMIVFRDIDIGLYSALTLYISAKVIDIMIEGVTYEKAIFIISDKAQEISERILVELERGVTGLLGRGMYTKQDKTVLLCIVSTREIIEIKNIVRSIDNKAFVIISDVKEALGEGFRTYEGGK